MRRVAESFAWPFRGRWHSAWLIGVVLMLFSPVTFIAILGYAIEAVRAAERDPSQGPPPWRWSARLFWDGGWTALGILAITAPFAIAYGSIFDHLPESGSLVSDVLVLFSLALPWGVALLVLMPHCSTRFAATSHWNDIFDFGGAIRGVTRNFAAWNATAAAIVTGWAIGLACAGALCIGVVPGLLYAILVSAHAAAAYDRSSSAASAR